MDDLTEIASQQYTHSVLRKRIVEHVFVGEALRRLWQLGVTDVEVLRSEFDAGGCLAPPKACNYRTTVPHATLPRSGLVQRPASAA